MVVLNGPFRLVCYAEQRGSWLEGGWRLELVAKPYPPLVEGKCELGDHSEDGAKHAALRVGMTVLEHVLKTEADATGE